MKEMKMKTNTTGLLLIIACFVFLASCAKKDKTEQAVSTEKKSEGWVDNPRDMPSSGGKTLEMILVMPDNQYTGDLKDSIGTKFLKKCEGIMNPEPLFDLVQMQEKTFFNSEMFQKHRNILRISLKASNKENKIYQNIDYKSYPQAYFEVISNNVDSLYMLLNRHSQTMINRFYNNEHRRVRQAFNKQRNTELNEKLNTTFGIDMVISNEFHTAIFNDDFAWLKKDYRVKKEQRTLNIMIHQTPYKSESMFKEEKIIELRDLLAKEYIAGPTQGSYMGTEHRYPFTRRSVKINGQSAIETRGLWRLYNDFMGGSFINYCFYNEKTQKFVMIDCFVYCPNQPKRDELMQLESVVYSLRLKK